jgi:glc operon protein GlcG
MRTKPCLTSADAQKMMAACKAEAEKNKWKVSIAIVDDAGVLLHLERMEGAGPTTPEVAHGKARTAALTKQPTRLWEERVKERPAFLNYPAGLSIWGGVPIIYQNECVGAIGVSGCNPRTMRKSRARASWRWKSSAKALPARAESRAPALPSAQRRCGGG